MGEQDSALVAKLKRLRQIRYDVPVVGGEVEKCIPRHLLEEAIEALSRPRTEGRGEGEPVAWRCFDLIMGTTSIIDDAKHAAHRRERASEWTVQPLYASPIREPEISREAISAEADRIVRNVNEYDDRTSPEDWPEALLSTSEELHAELMDFADAILNLAPVGGRGEGWRPISEAPRDGTRVDLWHTEFGREPDCYWGLPEHTCGEAGRYCDSDWHSLQPGWVDGLLNHSISDDQLTHFRPLPPPPQEQANEESQTNGS